MSPSKYRLTYFNIRSLGEPIRLLFDYNGVPFEDVRIGLGEEWAAKKASTGWGKMPTLDIDGKQQLTQSHAIGKYLGRKFNMDGATEFESAKCDEYVGVIVDLRVEWIKYQFEADPVKKDAAKKEFMNVTAPRYFRRYNAALEDNGGQYLVGNTLTWADLFVTPFLSMFEDTVDKNLLQAYPTLQKYKNRILEIPKIKKSTESRKPYLEF